MSKLPKLKVERLVGHLGKETWDFEEAKDFLFNYGLGVEIIVEGQVINSYEELVEIATKDCYKDKEFLEVIVAPYAVSGG